MKPLIAVFAIACLACGSASALDIATLERAMANPDRSAEDKARDSARKAPQVLDYLGLEAGMTVLDINASTGWYTEVLSYAVGPGGKVYAQNRAGSPGAQAIAAKAGRLGNVESWEQDISAIPAGSVDFAITALNYHDFYNRDPNVAAGIMNQVMGVLKSGGTLGIVDHEGNAGADNAALHRIVAQDVVNHITSLGFVVESQSEILNNPADDHTLPPFDPSIERNTDRFLLKVRKP
ncbi:MAG: hypothetical protein WD772_04125 [Pseudohongiellaceae bacterium]